MGYCDSMAFLDEVDAAAEQATDGDLWPHADTRWPKACVCGYEYQPTDSWQLFTGHLYRKASSGELFTLRDAPVGAMWNAPWYAEHKDWSGPDGRSLVVKTPGGDWMIDGKCSNCTLPNDDVHKCWVRHGEPPDLTVDKNGVTCSAGAGSILCGAYHGFLRNGWLEQC